MRLFPLLLFTCLTSHLYAQLPVSARLRSGIDLGMAYRKYHYAPSFAYYQLLNLGQKGIFSIGYTLRVASVYTDNQNFYTSPARLTRGKTGFLALDAPLQLGRIDTVRFDYASHTSVNLGIRAQVNLGPVELGGSADLLGLALGRTRLGQVISSSGGYRLKKASGADSVIVPYRTDPLKYAQPTRANLRLLGDNDIGNLAAEVYGRVRVRQRLAVKFGYQWTTAEMQLRVDNPVDNNKRYRHRIGMPFLALSFPFVN